jgi:flavin reductase (DIM6/NTAB) family NADH-FMN oxidoreductase RutF
MTMIVDFSNMSPNQVYHTMMQTIVPRPIAWVLSDNGNPEETGSQRYNLAPFSYFNAVASSPPVIMISIGKKPNGDTKDSAVNIIARKHFVVHIATPKLAEIVTETSRTLDFGDSELDHVNLETADFNGFPVPRLTDCTIAMACELEQKMELGDVPQTILFGRIRFIYVSEQVGTQDEKGRLTVDPVKLDPLSRLGADLYGTLGSVINIPRPK